MIVEAMSLVLAQVNQYIHQADGSPLGTADAVTIGNISQVENASVATDMENHIILSLVNVGEEASLKNSPAVTRSPSGAVNYQNPPVFLNLFLLFSANYTNYTTALRRLAQILSFFQSKKTFSLANSPGAVNNISPATDLTLHLDLLSLSYEEVNYLWGSLGGKQMPFAMYRGRLIEIRDQRLLDVGGRIEEIHVRGRGVVR
jgi:hypothetical protein